MLQHYFRQDNSTCFSSTPVSESLKILSVAGCLVNLLLTLSCNRNQDKFYNMNTFLFRFSIIMNEINMVIFWHLNLLKKSNIISFTVYGCRNFCVHKYTCHNISLCEKIYFSYLCLICRPFILVPACYLPFFISVLIQCKKVLNTEKCLYSNDRASLNSK